MMKAFRAKDAFPWIFGTTVCESKDRLIDRIPYFADWQKTAMKDFFRVHPNLESKIDWNSLDRLTWNDVKDVMEFPTEPIDPNRVPQLSNPVDEGGGIVSYAVEDTKGGMEAVRKIVDTHWGRKANPWCLIARNSAWSMDDAWGWWQCYDAVPKRIAFKDGRLLAFSGVFPLHTPDEIFERLYHEDETVPQEFIEWRRRNGMPPPTQSTYRRYLKEMRPDDYWSETPDFRQWWDRQNHSHLDLEWAKDSD